MKTPFSIKLLKMNKQHHAKARKYAVKMYKQCIKSGIGDKIRLYQYDKMKIEQEYLDDLNEAIRKLSPK